MNGQLPTPMRKLILTGTYAQYRDWLILHKANPRAAVFVNRPEQFMEFDPDLDEVVLGEGYRDNPAYMTPFYRWFVNDDIQLAC